MSAEWTCCALNEKYTQQMLSERWNKSEKWIGFIQYELRCDLMGCVRVKTNVCDRFGVVVVVVAVVAVVVLYCGDMPAHSWIPRSTNCATAVRKWKFISSRIQTEWLLNRTVFIKLQTCACKQHNGDVCRWCRSKHVFQSNWQMQAAQYSKWNAATTHGIFWICIQLESNSEKLATNNMLCATQSNMHKMHVLNESIETGIGYGT